MASAREATGDAVCSALAAAGAPGNFSSRGPDPHDMDRQRIIAIVLVLLMLSSSVAYVVSFF